MYGNWKKYPRVEMRWILDGSKGYSCTSTTEGNDAPQPTGRGRGTGIGSQQQEAQTVWTENNDAPQPTQWIMP